MFFIILGIILWIALAFWPASIARRKGHSFIIYFLLSIIISWLITLIIVAFLGDRTAVSQQPNSSSNHKPES